MFASGAKIGMEIIQVRPRSILQVLLVESFEYIVVLVGLMMKKVVAYHVASQIPKTQVIMISDSAWFSPSNGIFSHKKYKL